MKYSKFSHPEINTGSMADIAFLLLIFFLVTATIPKDYGINRKLPKLCLEPDCKTDIHERNILQIKLNNDNQIMIKNEVISITDIESLVIEFLDNNGDTSCDYCHGKKLKTLSDNPKKAIISLHNGTHTRYGFYIAVQDKLSKAYYELREEFAKNKFRKSIQELSKTEIKQVRDAYPFILSEANTK